MGILNTLFRSMIHAVKTATYAAVHVSLFGAVILLVYLLINRLLQYWMPLLEFKELLSPNIQTPVITVTGMLSVALIALYGVHTQNSSADKRHAIDKALDTKKEILLEVAAAFGKQNEYLLKVNKPDIAAATKNKILEDVTAAFYKAHIVCNINTLSKINDANLAWTEAIEKIIREKILSSSEIMIASRPYHIRIDKFNIACREELGDVRWSASKYLDLMLSMHKRSEELVSKIEETIKTRASTEPIEKPKT